MISFDKIVKKLWKLSGSIVTIDDISDITDPDFRKKSLTKRFTTYKVLYRLKAFNIITPIRQWLYFVGNGEETNIDTIIDERYWSIVKKILSRETLGEYFLSGNKALEILMKDYGAPKKLLVSGKNSTKNLQISDIFTLSIRPITSGKKTLNKNIFPLLKKYTSPIEMDGEKLSVACAELALLDTLLMRDMENGIDEYLVKKFLKRSSKTLNRKILWELVSLRYITAINRLRSIAKEMGNAPLYEMCIDIIKQEWGGCFVGDKK